MVPGWVPVHGHADGGQIAAAGLTDWRKLARGCTPATWSTGSGRVSRFVAAVGEAGDAVGHHPRVTLGAGYVDLELVTDEASTARTTAPSTSWSG